MAWVRAFVVYNQLSSSLVPGDSYASPGMVEFGKLIAEIHPGIFVHSVYIEEDQGQDRTAGFVCCLFFRRLPQFTHQHTIVRERERTNRLCC